MFLPQSVAQQKSKDQWKCLPKQKSDHNSSFESKTQKCTRFTPRSSPGKTQELKFLKSFNGRREQSQHKSPISKRVSKQKNILGSAINLTKQEQTNRVQQITSVRLQKKGSRGYEKNQMFNSYITNNNDSMNLSRIGCPTNKSFLGSMISKKGICQFLNFDEKETSLQKNIGDYRKLVRQFKQYLKTELQKMHSSYINTIFSIKKRYEEEIKQLKSVYQEAKKDNLGESDRMQSLGLDSVRLNSSNASKMQDTTLRRSNKIGSIMKCRKIITSSNAENYKKMNFDIQQKPSKLSSMKSNLLERSEKSIKQKVQRDKSFDKIFTSLQALKDAIEDHEVLSQKQKMQISHTENSILESSLKQGQWGCYSFKVPEIGTINAPTPKNIKKITFENGEFFKKQTGKLFLESEDQNTIEQVQICQQLEINKNISLKPPLLTYSQDLYGSIRTACFDDSDKGYSQLLSPKYKKKNATQGFI